MENILINKMTNEDLEKIKDNLSKDFDNFWDYEILKEELNSRTSKYIVAKKSNNIIVGFAGIKIILDEAEIMNIVTKKEERHQGIGKLLLNEIIKISKENNIYLINLEVNAKNTIAINLYKKYNFKEVGLRKKYYNGQDDAVLMTLKI